MSYKRVVPRDLFNESKLLKCLGRISVSILDNKLGKYGAEDFYDNENHEGFLIEQNPDSGDIYCLNYTVWIPMPKLGEKIALVLSSRLNSKENYPLICETFTNEIIEVFNDDGKFTKEFLAYLKLINDFEG